MRYLLLLLLLASCRPINQSKVFYRNGTTYSYDRYTVHSIDKYGNYHRTKNIMAKPR